MLLLFCPSSLPEYLSIMCPSLFIQTICRGKAFVPLLLPGQMEGHIMEILGRRGGAEGGALCPPFCPWEPFAGPLLHSLVYGHDMIVNEAFALADVYRERYATLNWRELSVYQQ